MNQGEIALSRDEELRRQFWESSARVRSSTLEVMRELDPLIGEGLEKGRPLTKAA